jgi:hypothetical protein
MKRYGRAWSQLIFVGVLIALLLLASVALESVVSDGWTTPQTLLKLTGVLFLVAVYTLFTFPMCIRIAELAIEKDPWVAKLAGWVKDGEWPEQYLGSILWMFGTAGLFLLWRSIQGLFDR